MIADIHVDNLCIDFVQDFQKECFRFEPNVYSCFAPFDRQDNNLCKYPTIDFLRQDFICYIKIKDHDIFLYDFDNTFQFMPIHYVDGEYSYSQPLVCYLEYLSDASFVLYIKETYNDYIKIYLRYEQVNQCSKQNIKLKVVNNKKLATTFKFTKLNLSSLLSESIDKK